MINLGLKFAKRFWTFINVQNSKGPIGLCKKTKNRVVTIMLSFQKRDFKICDDNFFFKISFFLKGFRRFFC